MSKRESESGSKPKPFRPFTGRTSAMGSSGWETYTVGFTLVGFIAAGAGIGWWLDSRLGTSYWLPILFFVGVFGGFRELFRVIAKNSKKDEQKRRENEAKTTIYTPPSATDTPSAPQRIFAVPPPPLEGSLEGETEPQNPNADVPETTEELIARLLEDPKSDDEADEKTK